MSELLPPHRERIYPPLDTLRLHGDETDVFGDAGYQGVEKREENLALPVTWHVAMRPSQAPCITENNRGGTAGESRTHQGE